MPVLDPCRPRTRTRTSRQACFAPRVFHVRQLSLATLRLPNNFYLIQHPQNNRGALTKARLQRSPVRPICGTISRLRKDLAESHSRVCKICQDRIAPSRFPAPPLCESILLPVDNLSAPLRP